MCITIFVLSQSLYTIGKCKQSLLTVGVEVCYSLHGNNKGDSAPQCFSHSDYKDGPQQPLVVIYDKYIGQFWCWGKTCVEPLHLENDDHGIHR